MKITSAWTTVDEAGRDLIDPLVIEVEGDPEAVDLALWKIQSLMRDAMNHAAAETAPGIPMAERAMLVASQAYIEATLAWGEDKSDENLCFVQQAIEHMATAAECLKLLNQGRYIREEGEIKLRFILQAHRSVG